MYRCIAYTTGESTKFICKLFNHKQINNIYYSYHTQNPEWCIDTLLNLNNLTRDVFDKNNRIEKIIRKTNNY